MVRPKGNSILTAGIVSLLFISIFSLSFFFFKEQANQYLKQSSDGVREAAQGIGYSIKSGRRIVAGLEDSLSSKNGANGNYLTPLIESVFFIDPDILQIRLIKQNGEEIVRYERGDTGDVTKIPTNELQNKSNRGYFKRALESSTSQLISRVELNQERGVIEQPWQPVIRVMEWLQLGGNERVLLIVNLSVKDGLDSNIGELDQVETWIVDQFGVLLAHPDDKVRFGHQTSSGWNLKNSDLKKFNRIEREGAFVEEWSFWLSEPLRLKTALGSSYEIWIVSHIQGKPILNYLIFSTVITLLAVISTYVLHRRRKFIDYKINQELVSAEEKHNDDLARIREDAKTLRKLQDIANIGTWQVNLETGEIQWSKQTRKIHEVENNYKPCMETAIQFYKEGESRNRIEQAVELAIETGKGWDLELELVTGKGRTIWVRAIGDAEFDGERCIRLFGVFQDITETYLLHKETHEAKELMRVTLKSIGDAVITTDNKAKVEWMNPIAEQLTGFLIHDAKGKDIQHVFNIVNEYTNIPVSNPIEECLAKDKTVELAADTKLISQYGEEYSIADSAAPIKNENGETIGAVMVFHDVTEQRRANNEVEYRATHDALTGILNRSAFETKIEQALHDCHSNQNTHALLFIDLDHFKIVNDTCGHAAGDELLKQVTNLMKREVRSSDIIARIGGDEYAVILSNCEIARATTVANDIRQRVDAFRYYHGNQSFRVGTSIGLVPISDIWTSLSDLMRAVDGACYAAKEGGRNRVHVWEQSDMDIKLRHVEMGWATKLERALDERRFDLFAQRIFSVEDEHQALHVEVLLRLRDERNRYISPGTFLPIAERYFLSARIDLYVIEETIDLLQKRAVWSDIKQVNINVSGQSISDRRFHSDVINVLQALPRSLTHLLCFEITETTAVRSIADAVSFVDKLKEIGVNVALDDFGSGASSFGYLKNIDTSFLKIDGQFVRAILSEELDRVAVRSFIDVAKVRNIPTVAEFVENEEIYNEVVNMGIDYVQGYYLHKPELFDELLSTPFVSLSKVINN
ncbi:putative diguanylate cyclase YegE [Saliniradius amylolyticus]|uniref:Putative diguanylate cyclase YegE n=1 Tax=Saliniradius amylolyticus TaxID=2183582 RepID=A0A2S2E2N9_9ALTE|nr:EAL domain-containing protein [Saliniradius amylolyticus]AWL11911.1 putative diguanylate cyclase YegE [Saliniradius amylolyticus]